MAAVLLVGIVPQASIAQTMSVPGGFSVGATGAATYNIPIAVPPGTAGLAPSLSLEYNSQGGNGIVGVGWSLSGLLSIGRCPQTFAQDGVRGGINYDANDRFCLDGQRLVAISGTYGADGTEYRTEVESFSRVISHGAAGTGPAWFEVHTKSGQIMEFGHTADSQVLALGKPTARNWALNKVGDTKGNYFTVTYTNDTTNGQAYPIEIDYTGNAAASVSPYNKVQFIYATRPDINSAYQAGSLTQTTVRLTDVQTYAGASLVADYKLTYAQGAATGRSQLASLALCDGTGNCLPATTFNWQNGVTGTTSVVANVAGQDGQLAGYVPYVADFNGDGLPDIMWDAEANGVPGSSGTRVLWTNTGAGTFSVNTNFAGQNGTLLNYVPYVADYNRDGRADILWFFKGSTTRWTSNNAGTVVVTPGPALPNVTSKTNIAVADIDGDGRADLQIYESTSPPTLHSFLTTSTGALTEVSQTSSAINLACPPAGLSTADFDGDGRMDNLLQPPTTGSSGCISTSGVQQISFGNGDGTFRTVAGSDNSVATYAPTYLDLNGDGKNDVLWTTFDSNGRSNGSRIVWISKGDGTFAVVANPGGTNGTLTGYVAYPGDFNGDGKADILWVQTDTNGLSTGTRVLWVGKGDGTFTVVSNFAGQDGQIVGYVPILADFNGDGKTDVLWDKRVAGDNRSQGTRVLWLSDGVVPDVISGVTSGLGAMTTLTYKPLSNSSVYTKDNTAIDPTADVQGNIVVVSRVDTVDGVGGTKSATYSYAGAKVDLGGRGFLGFRQMVATDMPTNIALTTTYRQDFPYIALVASTTTALSATTLNQTTNSYQFSNASGAATLSVPSATSAPYRVSVSQTASSSSDLDGSAIPSSTTNYQYDAYGNATQVVASVSDGYSKTTTSTYTNDTTNWLLGRLTASTVTSQAPQQLGQYCALPWGGTISNGQSVTAYSAASAPVGQACSTIAQTRTCTNGTLSGTFAQQSCTALCALPWGGTISQGQSATAYSTAAVPAPQTCTSVGQTRTCGVSGVLSGSFTNQSCVVRQPKTVFLTVGTTWTVPADWNSANNTIEVIGAGAGGFNGGGARSNGAPGQAGSSSSGGNGGNGGDGGTGGSGGGGGAYSLKNNITLAPNSMVTISVGAGGSAGVSGTDTYFNGTSCATASACAKGGTAGGVGGVAASGVGDTKVNGGSAAAGAAGAIGGVGGSPNGIGGPGGTGGIGGAGGRGGAGGGAGGPHGAGNSGVTTTGGSGDAGNTAAGANGTQYSASFGSGGGANAPGSASGGGGGAGALYFTTPGNGGNGAAGTIGSPGGTSGTYGAGGAGGAGGGAGGGGGGAGIVDSDFANPPGAGGAGRAGGAGSAGKGGLIVITYTPGS